MLSAARLVKVTLAELSPPFVPSPNTRTVPPVMEVASIVVAAVVNA